MQIYKFCAAGRGSKPGPAGPGAKTCGFKIKFLAVRENRPNLGSFRAEIYKGFPNFIKENISA